MGKCIPDLTKFVFKSLCTSGINTVRIWNSETGRMTRQLTLPKENQNDVTVWSCLFLNDNTVVVGDSLGRVIFYDGKLGALLNTFKVIIHGTFWSNPQITIHITLMRLLSIY